MSCKSLRQRFVPLANFVTVKPSNNVDTLQRVDGTPIMMILANVAPDVLADTKVKEIQAGSTLKTGRPNFAFSSAEPMRNKQNLLPLLAWHLVCHCYSCLCCW